VALSDTTNEPVFRCARAILSTSPCGVYWWVCCGVVPAAGFAAPLEKVVLQLKWFHQFQFAGYYAAKAQGYYAAEGLEVEIRPRDPGVDPVGQVSSGQANYGIGDSGLLGAYARGAPIVALAAVFQHDPLVFVSRRQVGRHQPLRDGGQAHHVRCQRRQ
jgi:ABC-type nitrate/sulfonate/bicarbonate transport system substrate-binding protein